ncbi:homogentisate phytyltransferase 1, chloroplastic isoform X2 [Lactuca sativa]|uniref:homogentisate phytyltransferase 1, chloroplastic isoform X2 n=1 Tax=Lactuca sativa TaxID=4236 RepID=UPI000CD81BFB|nr:homogentisate phytyltransferase 1, chloroplastic isoform X2 [Lactuca sativa]
MNYPRRRTQVLKSDAPNPHGSAVVRPQIDSKLFRAKLNVIYRYAKPYTLGGMVLSIISTSLLTVNKLSDFTPSFFIGVLQVIIGGSLANSYVAAINQLSDIDIDKVNKPYLPLPSGELSVKTAIRLTSLYAILGFFLGWSTKSWPLKLGLLLWYASGTAYSVHACIYGRPLMLSKHAIFVSGIMCIFGLVAALFKDIPDVEGDKINGVNSLASQVGKKPVFWLCIWLLEMAYGVAILIGLSSTYFWIGSIMVISHSILGFILWKEANLVDLESDQAIESFYRFIWKLRGVEDLLMPLLRF